MLSHFNISPHGDLEPDTNVFSTQKYQFRMKSLSSQGIAGSKAEVMYQYILSRGLAIR